MHSYVFQISDKPIKKDSLMTEFDIPEWFVGSIADYVLAVSDDEREKACQVLGSIPGLTYTGATKKFEVLDKELYFIGKYAEFMDCARKVAGWSLNDFMDDDKFMDFYRMRGYYDDEYGFYVCEDNTSIQSLDSWIRSNNKRAYIGTVFDYHA